MIAKGFWYLLSIAAVVWYLTVTIYVAIRGAKDIKQMLGRFSMMKSEPEAMEAVSPVPDVAPEAAE